MSLGEVKERKKIGERELHDKGRKKKKKVFWSGWGRDGAMI